MTSKDEGYNHPLEQPPRGLPPNRLFVFITLSGSVYVIASRASTWWAIGVNVPNPRSGSVAGRWYRIEPPELFPPRVGFPFEFNAAKDLPLNSEDRMPGGGKITSIVVAIRGVAEFVTMAYSPNPHADIARRN